MQSILVSDSLDATVDATVTDTLKDDVITKLRSQYLELSRRLADWTVKYGAEHLAVVNLRNQMNEIQNSVRAELQRIAETYKSDLEVAKQREASIKQQLSQAVSQSQVNNQAQVSLRELQSNAESYQALYDNFLQRYMESVQQQSFPITDARVISAATRPLCKSNPKGKLALGVARMLGLAFGVWLGPGANSWIGCSDQQPGRDSSSNRLHRFGSGLDPESAKLHPSPGATILFASRETSYPNCSGLSDGGRKKAGN